MIRTCPKCGRDISYVNISSLNRAKKNNTLCRFCSTKGKVVSETTKQRMKDNHYDSRGKNNSNYGKISVLKDKKWADFRTEESINKSKKILSKGLFTNGKHSDETKKYFSKLLTERNLKNNPAKRTDVKIKLRDLALTQISTGYLGKKTSIELKLENLLLKNSIEFISQYKFGFYVFDVYLPKYDIFIECDGDYFHANPKFYKNLTKTQYNNVWRGKAKTNYINNFGKLLLRFWEDDINNNLELIEKEILLNIKINE